MILRIFFLLVFSLGFFLGAAPPCAAQQGPIEISADESLEWYQDTQLYVARGKAKAVRDDKTIEADILTAHQRDTKVQPVPTTKGKEQDKPQALGGDIDRMTAEGNVHFYSPTQQVFGQKAVYDADSGFIKVTGDNLKLITEKNVVTAKDSLEYDENKKTAIARGHAIGEQGANRVEADVLTAHFAPNPQGQLAMTDLIAKGNVIIVTKDGGISRGDEGVYDTQKNSAVLSNHVRITRGQTQLAGDKALVDFTSGQSRLINSGSGRVRVLLPSSSAKKEKAKP
ncbi:MAG: LptA/OstA family protein [Bdellovibrionales bacterium]|jgi:lipopolysaccharide export system protein LptA